MYQLVVFADPTAASHLVGLRVAEPLALMVRFGSGRLVEIDLGLSDEEGVISDAARGHLPPSSSALIFRERDIEVLDELLGRWEHVVYTLRIQEPIDEE